MNKIFVLGSVNMDMVIKTPYIPKSGETLMGRDFMLNGGGKGANQAVACSKQEVKTYLIGALGNDVFGRDLASTLNNYQVDTKYLKILDDISTGVAMIIIHNNDNRIILDSGANAKITTFSIDEALTAACENDVFITQLENNLDAVFYGLQKAKEKKMITIFNPAPAVILDKNIYQYVDYLILNESECEILTTINPENEQLMQKAYTYLSNLGVKNLIITLGSNGSICFKDKEVYRIKANKVKAIDTTAAGDTFVGTFAAQLIKKTELEEALNYASVVSSLTCLKEGAQQSIPTLQEVYEYFNK